MDKLLAMTASDPATCFNVVIGIVAVLLVVIIVFAVRLKHARRDKHYLSNTATICAPAATNRGARPICSKP